MRAVLLISIASFVVIYWLESIFPYFTSRHDRVRHGVSNIALGGLNGVVSGFLFPIMILNGIEWAQTNSFGLLHFISGPPFIKAILAFVFFDLWMYLWHRANHRVKFLWRFHRTHHTDCEMDTTTAIRFHPGEIALSFLARFAVIPLLGISYLYLVIYEACLQPIILFHHSNVAFPERWDRIFRACIVTPNMHRVHHSQEGPEFNSNYSSVFSFWDRIFATFKRREDTHKIIFGLKILQDTKWQGLKGMLITPFK